MEDVLIRGITENRHFKVAFVRFNNLAEKLRKLHNTSPLVTLALTRFIGSSLLLSAGLKQEEQYSIHLKCDGVLKGFSADVNPEGIIRAYPYCPQAGLQDPEDIINVKKGLDTGRLNVIKWNKNVKEPYKSITNLNYGSVAKDFTYYLTKSEQIPSAIALGEYMEKDGSISHAGGIIIQAMPDADENEVGFLETTISMKPTLIEMLLESFTLDMIMDKIVGIMGFVKLHETKPGFQCNCSRGNVESALISTGRNELESMYYDGERVEVVCEYCKTNYGFSKHQIKKLIDEIAG
jgi:molecular chaperone Hsp33